MTETEKESSEHRAAGGAALPRVVHIGIPIASALVILAFALTLALPADQSGFSPAGVPLAKADAFTSTVFFIPIYITIVIILVFASMYLFKTFVEKDVSTTGSQTA